MGRWPARPAAAEAVTTTAAAAAAAAAVAEICRAAWGQWCRPRRRFRRHWWWRQQHPPAEAAATAAAATPIFAGGSVGSLTADRRPGWPWCVFFVAKALLLLQLEVIVSQWPALDFVTPRPSRGCEHLFASITNLAYLWFSPSLFLSFFLLPITITCPCAASAR